MTLVQLLTAKKQLFSSKILVLLLGTLIEAYDFALYGLSAKYLAESFFPLDDPQTALLKTFGIFIAGALSKPLGALLFGTIGDRFGRSTALKLTLIGIACPTLLIGLLPSAIHLGNFAALLLLICRLLQGMFKIGEADGLRIYLYEQLNAEHRYLGIGFLNLIGMLGVVLASLAVSWTAQLPLLTTGWRIPFIVGGLAGIVIFLLRMHIEETQPFLNYVKKSTTSKNQNELSPSFFQVFKKNSLLIFMIFLLYGSIGGDYHFYLIFFGTYLESILNLIDPQTASTLNTQILFCYACMGPIAGWITDRLGLFKTMTCSLLGLIILSACNAYTLAQGHFYPQLWISIALLQGCFHLPGYFYLIQFFKVEERFRCISFGHALGSIVLSGSAPWFSLWLWQHTTISYAPILYILALLLITLLGIVIIQFQHFLFPKIKFEFLKKSLDR